MPRVSIVIPTRDRADLLRFALKSAVEQSYQDIEVVVCDNHSSDETRKVVDAQDAAGKVVYVRADKPLSMPDNWDLALSKTTGEYVTFLTDDSYLFPDSVAFALREMDRFSAKVAVWRYCVYFAQNWREPARRNILYIPTVTNESRMLDSKTSLQRMFDSDEDISILIPKALNSMCHRSILEKAISTQGRFFVPPCPDYTSAAGVLLNVPNYLLIDWPLYIDTVTPASIGATSSLDLGESSKRFASEFAGGVNDVGVLGIPTSTASITKSLEAIKGIYGDRCPEINQTNAMCSIVDRLVKVKVNGGAVGGYFETLDAHVGNQSWRTQLAVARQRFMSELKWRAVKTIRSSPILERIETLRNIRIVDGKSRFANIEECAKVVREEVAVAPRN
jgi:hypothetical protein